MISATKLSILALHNAQSCVSVRGLISVGEIMGHNENAMRVALARLKRKTLIEQASRGHYQLSEKASVLDAFISRWSKGEKRRRAFKGQYLLAFVKSEKRSARDNLVRALSLSGFERSEEGCFLRPDNLSLSTAELREFLSGAFNASAQFRLATVCPEPALAKEWRTLFSAAGKDDKYRKLSKRLATQSAAIAKGAQEVSALLPEATLLGEKAVATLAFDALLPSEWHDDEARRALTKQTKKFTQNTRKLWRQVVPELAFSEV